MRDKLIIIGASGHGEVVADIAIKMNRWKEIKFLDDDGSIEQYLDLKVIGKSRDASKYKETTEFIVAIGDNQLRKKIQEELMNSDYSIVTLIHPDAIIGIDVQIGRGTVVMAGVVINSSSRIGSGCIINTSASVDHDSIIKDFVHLSPGVRTGGKVNIDEGTWLGIGSVVSNNINISAGSIVGAGAVVIRDIIEPGVYVGVPAKKIK